MDVHVPLAITRALRRKGHDVLTAQEDGTTRLPDPALLQRAATLGRVLFTQDDDFLAEAARLHRTGTTFATVIYAHQFTAIGICVTDLALILSTMLPDEAQGHVLHLPL
jgi:Domain of unknown function (DUF5615)